MVTLQLASCERALLSCVCSWHVTVRHLMNWRLCHCLLQAKMQAKSDKFTMEIMKGRDDKRPTVSRCIVCTEPSL